MDRRELLKMIALVTGGSVIGGEFFLAGCRNEEAGTGMTFTDADIAFLDEVAETILPKTNTPGAKEAEVGRFMTVMVNDCYEEADQKIFHAGMKKLDEACNQRHSHDFLHADAEQRKELLELLDKESGDYAKSKQKGDPNHYFTMIKQLTLLGFFTSKPALTACFDYRPVPGKYDGALPWKKGDKLFV